MRLITALLLAGVALPAMAERLRADDPQPGLEVLDTAKLAIDAAPSLPEPAEPSGLSLAAPGLLPLPPGEAVRPSTASPSAPAVSWSGYTRAGVVYRGGN